MKLFTSPHRPRIVAGVKSILHLPLLRRLVHRNSRRTIGIMSLSICVMLGGSLIASNKEWLADLIGSHHVFFDTLGYFLHAAGAIPALRYVEPFWMLLSGIGEVAE